MAKGHECQVSLEPIGSAEGKSRTERTVRGNVPGTDYQLALTEVQRLHPLAAGWVRVGISLSAGADGVTRYEVIDRG